jgi:hypothetical protein
LFCGPFVRAGAADHDDDHDVCVAGHRRDTPGKAGDFPARRALAIGSHGVPLTDELEVDLKRLNRC